MKKTLLALAIVLLVAALTVCTMSGCKLFDNLEIEGDGHTEIGADTLADCKELLDNFFEDSLGDVNLVVTAKANGEDNYVESVKGDKDLIRFANGFTSFAYVEGETYFLKSNIDGGVDVDQGREFYDDYFCYFLQEIKGYLEGEGTCNASWVYDDHDVINKQVTTTTSSGTFTLSFTTEQGSVSINATATNGLVQTLSLAFRSQGGNSNLSYAFAYGNADPADPFAE